MQVGAALSVFHITIATLAVVDNVVVERLVYRIGLDPDTLALDKRGGYQRDTYEGYYQGGSAGILGEANKDGRLPGKELVVGIDLEGSAKAYPFTVIAAERVINDAFRGEGVVVTFEPVSETGAVFQSQVDGQPLTFHTLPDAVDGIILMRPILQMTDFLGAKRLIRLSTR